MPKCFQLSGLKKSLFPCKSNPHANNDNYVVFNYTDTKNTSEMSINDSRNNQPATSTMIESATTKLQEEITANSQPYFVLMNHEELEMTRTECTVNNFALHCTNQSMGLNEYEDITIIKHNNSPMADYKSEYQLDDSLPTPNDYFHSTKLSNETSNCLQCVQLVPSPTGSPGLTQTANLGDISPVSTSSGYSPRTYDALDSLINDLSMFAEKDTQDQTHVCSSDYEATFVDDVSVHFADTVKILRDNNDDWLYVQVTGDGRTGYVPKTIVLDLKQFIEQLKIHQLVNQPNNSLISLPIRV